MRQVYNCNQFKTPQLKEALRNKNVLIQHNFTTILHYYSIKKDVLKYNNITIYTAFFVL